jgi:alpha-amylase/alpha-mannosidase (GH57 family)
LSFQFPHVSVDLPPREERYKDRSVSQSLPPRGAEFVNKDVRGFFQFHTSWYRPWRTELLKMFETDAANGTYPPSDAKIGIHIRAGDYDNTSNRWRAPVRWYLDWLANHYGRFRFPIPN